MREFHAQKAAIGLDPGMIHVGFEFPGSTPGHLLLSFPDGSADAEVFEDSGHYIELGDQLYGRDSGVEHAWIDDPRHFRLRLTFDAGVEGPDVSVTLDEPMTDELMALMRQLPGAPG